MRYIDSAISQLAFAIKLMDAAEDGLLDLETIDRPLTISDGPAIWVLPDRVLQSPDDLILACQNNVSIAYGAAAITLNKCREEAGVSLPVDIVSECDQWVALVYQIRNAFAHDIAEPRWQISKVRYAREYRVGPVSADLRALEGTHFDYSHVAGPEGLYRLKCYGDEHAFGREP